jgi:hypothetical protein
MRSSRSCASIRVPGKRTSVWRFFQRHKITFKSLRAAEQERPDVGRARRHWKRAQGMLDSKRLVFIDETAANTKMTRLNGHCPRGKRLIGRVPHGHWKTITFVAALRRRGMTAPFVTDRPMNGTTFLTYVKSCLAPTLRRGHVVVTDGLPAYKVSGVREAIEAPRRRTAIPAAVLSRPEPHRDAVQPTQGLPSQSRQPNRSPSVPQDRFVRSHRPPSPKLFQARRLCVNSIGICSRRVPLRQHG